MITPQLCPVLGVSRSRVRTELRHGTWQLLARGVVLTRPDAPTRLDWAEAGLLLGGPSAALSGWDAVRLHGIRCTAPGCVLVLTREGRSRRVGPVLVRRTDRPAAGFRAERPGRRPLGTGVLLDRRVWRRYRAGLETDSRTFHFDVEDWEATLDRHNVLTRGRLSLVHYSPTQLLTGLGRLDELEQWLRARAAELGEPYVEGCPGRRSPRVAPQPFVLPA